MEVRFSSAALTEVKETAAHYDSQVAGLGQAFVQRLREGVSEIKNFPLASRIIQGDFRRHLLARFPHGIIYEIRDNTIFVAAVMHLKRKPGYWEK